MTRTIKPERKAMIAMAFVTIALLPITGIAKSKPITTTDLLKTLRKGEPWDRGVLTATKTVMFQQAASGGSDANSVSKITLSYFTSGNCTGAVSGTGSYTTPNGTSYPISLGTPFGLVAASTWNVGSTKLSIADMTTIGSVAVTLKSTNNNTPQANFSGVSFACVPVTCAGGQCTSGSGTQSFQLKSTTAEIGDPADGGVIGCIGGGLNNFVVPSSNNAYITWGDNLDTGATSTTDGATNTALIVTQYGAGVTYAAGVCQAYAATGGYTTGWFLPAEVQINCLYTNQSTIGGFDVVPYCWSSTEGNGFLAIAQYFPDGSVSYANKVQLNTVRCARAFTP